MTRAFVAVAQPDERHSLGLVLSDLGIEVVGEASDWPTVEAQVPGMDPDMLLADWDLLSAAPASAVNLLREACPTPLVVVLISQLEARQQAARCAGADTFISKGESPASLAEHLRVASHTPPLVRALQSHRSVQMR